MPQDADLHQHRSAAPAARTRLAIDFDIDRSKAFRRARRNTALVRILRVTLPVAAVGLMSTYLIFMQHSISISAGENKVVSADKVKISTQALIAHAPRYEGFDGKGGRFLVKSKTAKQAIGQNGPVLLDTIDGTLTDANNVVTNLKARAGTFDTSKNVLELFERIDVTSQNGMRANLTRATVHTKDGIITSDRPVLVTMPTGTVRGKAVKIVQKQRLVTFSGGVVARLKQDARPKATDAANKSGGSQQPLSGSGEPVDITSSKLHIDDARHLASFSGNVVATQSDATLETEVLDVAYEGGNDQAGATAGGGGGGPGGQPPATTQSGRVKRMTAPQTVVMTRGAERAKGSSGVFDAVTDKATLLGPVELTAGDGRRATSERADIDHKNDTITLTGNVFVEQQENQLKGHKLFVDRKAGKMALTTAGGENGKERISALLKQAQPQASAQAQAPGGTPENVKSPKAPEAKPSNPTPLAGLGGDRSKPIDILAARLDVDDTKKQAVFRGKVEAKQGDYTLFSEELIAIYTGQTGMILAPQPGAADKPTSPASSPAKTGAQLQKVFSRKRVRVVTNDGRTASGDTAEFDLKANRVFLTGHVILTQGKSVTRGPRALIDMDRGTMQLLENAVATAEPGSQKKRQRVEALFFPQQFNETLKAGPKDKSGATTSPGSAPGGWSSTTTPVRPGGN